MNPSLLAGLGALLVVLIWWRGRLRPAIPLVRNGDTAAVAALNRAQIALAQSGGPQGGSPGGRPIPGVRPPALALGAAQLLAPGGLGGAGLPMQLLGPAPQPPLRSGPALRLYRTQLEAAFRAGGAARLEAIRQARQWGHRSTLPMLRRGLRSPDPAVVREAVAAIDRFRGPAAPGPSPSLGRSPQAVASLPRNVARMR